MYRFGELDVPRVRRILNNDLSPEPAKPPGKPPQLCDACQYRIVFEALRKQDCIVAGDIGCYTLGVLQPFEAIDSCVCMGASLGVGLGLRHVLPPDQARRVVSVIGDSTFVHSGISGLVEMVYNPPPNGHVLIILDNATTAMTGHQEHPGTGRKLDHEPTGKVVIEDLARSLGIRRVHVIEPRIGTGEFDRLLTECLESNELAVIIARRPCILIAKQLKQYEEQRCECDAAQPARAPIRFTHHVSRFHVSRPHAQSHQHRRRRPRRPGRPQRHRHPGRCRPARRLRCEEERDQGHEPARRLGDRRRAVRPARLQPDGAGGRSGFPAGARADPGGAAPVYAAPRRRADHTRRRARRPVAEQEDAERGPAGRVERALADGRRAMARRPPRRLRRDVLRGEPEGLPDRAQAEGESSRSEETRGPKS